LASTSRYRQELLGRLGLGFSCIAPGVDETALPGEAPSLLAVRLARAKAATVAARHPKAWVIGSDQVAVLASEQGELALGKPGNAARCIEQLKRCSGASMSFVTAVALMHEDSQALVEFTDTTRVRFRELDAASIERYVSKEQPFDCAGGFKSEGLGISLCESIQSEDPSALIGLPLIRLSAALREAGFELP
jgi:septum formation protein